MKISMLTITAALLMMATGCSSTGPMISDIWQERDGTIWVKRCHVRHVVLTGALGEKDCQITGVGPRPITN
jgi:hypothetical protein